MADADNRAGGSGIRARVEELVADIPPGRVMTYGDVAACCGYPGAARRVGAIAHGGAPGLPWHRVVSSGGRLATVRGADPDWQSAALASEGVAFRDGRILGFDAIRWYPDPA